MGFALPNPTVPTNGQPLDATPILANEVAIAQAIAAFDGSQIQPGTVAGSALANSANPNTLLAAITFPFVSTGCVWNSVSGLAGGMAAGTLYYNGIPVTVNSVASHTFTASKDTYIDIDRNGNITYVEASNNGTSPALTANSIRVAIVVTGASSIGFINQGQTDSTLSGFAPVVSSASLTVADSIGNLIYPTDPNSKVLCYRERTTDFSDITVTTVVDVTGMVAPSIVPANRKIKITLFQNASSGNGGLEVRIRESTTTLSRTSIPGTTLNATYTQTVERPSTGLHTYLASISQGGAGTMTFRGAAEYASHILVELE